MIASRNNLYFWYYCHATEFLKLLLQFSYNRNLVYNRKYPKPNKVTIIKKCGKSF